MKRLFTGCIMFVFCCLVVLPIYAQTPELPQETPENSYSLNDAIHFVQLVADAAHEGDCDAFQETVRELDPAVIERAAYVIANIKDFNITDSDIQKVSAYSTAVAAFAKTCPAVLDFYKAVASKAIALQKE